MSAAPGTPTTPLPRRRRNTLLAVLLVIALGAPARLFSADLPVLYTQFIGDALWALMIYLLWALLLPRSPAWVLALLTLGIAWGIEFSQLLHTPCWTAFAAHVPEGCCWAAAFYGAICWHARWARQRGWRASGGCATGGGCATSRMQMCV